MGGIGRINWAHHLSELGQTPQSSVTEKLLIISSFTYYPVVTALEYEKMAFKFFRKGTKTYTTNIDMPNKSKVGKRWLSLSRNIQLDSGSIKTSPRDGLRAFGMETTPNCATLGHSDLL